MTKISESAPSVPDVFPFRQTILLSILYSGLYYLLFDWIQVIQSVIIGTISALVFSAVFYWLGGN
jgi:hypothetical protein